MTPHSIPVGEESSVSRNPTDIVIVVRSWTSVKNLRETRKNGHKPVEHPICSPG
jgi:hypothetical protein